MKHLCLLLIIITVNGCMLTPFDQQEFSDATKTIEFSGHSPNKNAPIEIYAMNPTTGEFEAFASGLSGNTESMRMDDHVPLYKFSIFKKVPEKYWVFDAEKDMYKAIIKAGFNNAFVATVNADYASCYRDHRTVNEFGKHCKANAEHTATIYAREKPVSSPDFDSPSAETFQLYDCQRASYEYTMPLISTAFTTEKERNGHYFADYEIKLPIQRDTVANLASHLLNPCSSSLYALRKSAGLRALWVSNDNLVFHRDDPSRYVYQRFTYEAPTTLTRPSAQGTNIPSKQDLLSGYRNYQKVIANKVNETAKKIQTSDWERKTDFRNKLEDYVRMNAELNSYNSHLAQNIENLDSAVRDLSESMDKQILILTTRLDQAL